MPSLRTMPSVYSTLDRSIARVARVPARWLAIAVLVLFVPACGFNEIIDRDEDVKAAWAEVQNQYQRRADLIPNLVKTVKGAANFEQETLRKVVEARAKVGQMNVDASILDDRVGLEFTYYNKRMRDVIISTGVAGSTGFGGTFYGGTIAQMVNLGETSNRGIELAASFSPVRTRDFAWDSRVNVATNANELVSFGDDRTEIVPFAPYGNVQRHREGYPLAGYWAQRPERNPDGTPVINASGVVQLEPLEFIGPSAPTREVGLLNTFTLFRDFRLSVLLDYKGGHYLYNWKELNRCVTQRNCERLSDPRNFDPETGVFLPAILPEGADPEAYVWRQNIPAAYIERADFVKLRDVSLTYELPVQLAGRVGASNASITLAGRNLALWTDYSGLDPETNNYGNRDFIRADVYAAPMTRRWSMSLNVGF
jgi:hypothetical protein